MDETSTNNLEEIGTAAHLMMEAVDKASHELERTVSYSGEYLQSFNQALSKNFIQQLAKLTQQSLRAVDKGSEEMQARKEDFAERLAELEQTEINSLIQASKEVRQELNLSLQKTIDLISQLVESQVSTLRPLVLSQHKSFANLSEKECENAQKLIDRGKNNLSEEESTLKKDLAKQVKELEQAMNTELEANRQRLMDKIKGHQESLIEQANQAQTELNQFIVSSKDELDEKGRSSDDSLSSSAEDLTKSLIAQIDNWQVEMNQLTVDFEKMLSGDRDSFDRMHQTKIERQVSEVKDEIQTIAGSARSHLAASYQLFHLSLKRLERKYHERLERLCSQFDTAIAQENKLLSGFSAFRTDQSSQANQELKELLNTRLKARGLEIVKTFKRQVELFDLEHARFASSCNERIETAYESAKDFLEQQLKTMNTDMDRTLRSFRVELSQLNLQLPQIKDAGHAAALAVTAYKRARLII